MHRAAYNAELCRTRSPATGLASGYCLTTHAAHTTLSETWRPPASSPLSRRAGRAGGMAAAQACCCLAGSSSRRCTAETACTARRHTAAQPEETKLCALHCPAAARWASAALHYSRVMRHNHVCPVSSLPLLQMDTGLVLPCVQWTELWEDIVGRPSERIPGGEKTD